MYANIQKSIPNGPMYPKKNPKYPRDLYANPPQINRNTWVLALVPQRDKNPLHRPKF